MLGLWRLCYLDSGIRNGDIVKRLDTGTRIRVNKISFQTKKSKYNELKEINFKNFNILTQTKKIRSENKEKKIKKE